MRRSHHACDLGFCAGPALKGTGGENNFAGTEIYVPKNWHVVNQIHSAFGGVDEKGVSQPDGIHTLYLTGECNFGGIDIIYI